MSWLHESFSSKDQVYYFLGELQEIKINFKYDISN